MSTDLGGVVGQFEVESGEIKELNYGRTHLMASSFFGGSERGKCIQLTLAGGEYIQLDKKEARKLMSILSKFLK